MTALLSGTAMVTPALAQDATYLGRIQLENSGSASRTEGEGTASIGPVTDSVVPNSAGGALLGDVPLVNTPVSVSVVTNTQIEEQGAQSVAEALRYTPGVFSEYRGTSNLHDETQLRGFGSRTFVPKALDGMSFGRSSLGQLDPYYLQSVEVIKGPNSIAFGQVTPGGLINMTSKRPTDDQGNELVLTFGSDDYKGIATDLQGNLDADGDLRYRVVASLWDKTLQGDFGQSRLLLAPSLTWEIGDSTELTVYALYQNEPEAGQRGFMPYLGTMEPTNNGIWIDPDFVSYAPDFDTVERETWALGYEATHGLANGWSLTHMLRYSSIDLFHSQLGLWDSSDDGAGNYPLYLFESTDYAEELTARVSLDGEVVTGALTHNLTFGVDYLNSDVESTYARDDGSTYTYNFADMISPTNAQIAALTLDAYTSETHSELSQTGIFAQDRVEWGNWDLLMGLRYDWATTRISETYAASWGGGTSDDTYEAEALTGRVGLSYEFANGVVPYFSYSTSFEPVTELDDDGDASYDPTTARQWEAGVKWASADGKILLSAAYFDIQKKNIVESYLDEMNNPVTDQIGSVRSKGIELEAKAELMDNLTVIASYFNTDATYETGDYAGNTFYAIPTEQASVWVQYGFTEGVDGSLGVRYVGPSWNYETNDFQVPSYTLVDAGLSVDLGVIAPEAEGVKAAVTVQNLTDERYVTSCVREYCWLGEGRNWSLRLSYDW
ncbi:TonB-dependent siderophore receptor [Pseudoruegeria sp. HB172150]|uniref:TonB-dependent siderophore receptor n=1 Tax=Pseudoruegeria sp. HB172150 TaxID=2721164 RepID=UPI001557D60F|nr:TonB-dependent siderophore receptor [Pseudoruegeria sp. HB172150]